MDIIGCSQQILNVVLVNTVWFSPSLLAMPSHIGMVHLLGSEGAVDESGGARIDGAGDGRDGYGSAGEVDVDGRNGGAGDCIGGEMGDGDKQ